MKTLKKTAATLGLVSMGLVPSVVTLAGNAQAATRDGACDNGEFCLSFNSGFTGSISDFSGSISDYGTDPSTCYTFRTPGKNGYNQCVKNNAASARNLTSHPVTVYFNSDYQGDYQVIQPGQTTDLVKVKNQNASHSFGEPTSPGTGQTPRDDYDHNARDFAQNNCTAFAAWRVASRLGIPAFNDNWKTHWGNAGTWDDAARRVGIRVDKTPTVGSIAVNDVHKVGHVAYVNKVYSDGSFDVEEYNWNNPLHYGTRSHVHVSQAQADFQWMIHFKG